MRRPVACLGGLAASECPIRRDAEAFFASPDVDRIAALAQLKWDAIALIREAARQRATGHSAPVSKFSRKPTHTYQRRCHYLVRHLGFQGEVRPLATYPFLMTSPQKAGKD